MDEQGLEVAGEPVGHEELARSSAHVWRHRLPRTETIMLAVGLAFTLGGKLVIVARQNPAHFARDFLTVVLADLAFFAGAVAVVSCLYLWRPRRWTARLALLLAALITAWSLLNVAWLIDSGVQLQPGVLWVLIRDFSQLWPLVQSHAETRWVAALLLLLVILGGILSFLWCLWRPRVVPRSPRRYAARAGVAAAATVIFLALHGLVRSGSELGFVGQTLGFSSHWHALASLARRANGLRRGLTTSRNIPRVGQRDVGLPAPGSGQLPNVVLLLLESVTHEATSLGSAGLDTTPELARLARQGVEFELARVPMAHTTKAFWASLTGSTPVVQADYAEAIPAEPPYEGLPSILARLGYRSGFFEMSKGSFECAPGFFNNLRFDWAWFRENLQDDSAYLGYLGGDDCRMIEPAMTWCRAQPGPFLLMMITSVTHDPFDVPAWFGRNEGTPYERYLRTIRYTDYFIGRLCAALRDNGWAENTILCILGDHGTSFRVKTGKGRWIPYEEVIRVPWVIWWPGRVTPGRRIEWPCSQLDVTPTILSLLGFDISRAGFAGKNALAPVPPDRRCYFASWFVDSPLGYVEGPRKVMYWPYLDKVFAYDLQADPHEEHPRLLDPEQAAAVKADVLAWRQRTQINVEAKRFTRSFLYAHWQTISTGRSAWAYYLP